MVEVDLVIALKSEQATTEMLQALISRLKRSNADVDILE